MSTAGYALSIVLLAITVASAAVAGVAGRRWLVPAWTGAPARLAEVVGAVATVVWVGELAGTVGQFRRATLVLGCVGFAACVHAASGLRTRQPTPAAPARPRRGPWADAELAAAVGMWGVLMATWGQRAAISLRTGILEDDTVAYHLPFALRFVQSGWVTRIPYLAPDLPTDFFPANSELIHGVGIALVGRDVLAPILNLAWLSLVLFAAWCVGRRFGRGPACVIAVGTLLATPILANTQAGAAQNDIVTLFFLLASVALLLHAEHDSGGLALSGLAAGLAVGSKLTMGAPVGALFVGVCLLAPHARRMASGLWWAIPALVGGGYWYARNLIVLGNPIPSVHLGPLPSPHIADLTAYFSIGHYLTSPHVLRPVLHTALGHALGSGWPLLLAVAVVGVALAVGRGDRVVRLVAVTAAFAAVVYVFTPSTALGPPGHPALVQVTANLRYFFPALVLAFVALPLAPVLRKGSRIVAAEGVLLIVLLIGLTSRTVGWEVILQDDRAIAALIGIVACTLAGIAYATRKRPAAWRIAGAIGLAAVLAVILLPIDRRYLTHRYTADPWGLTPAYVWARGVDGARVGVDGFYQVYPLAGPALANRLVYVGVRGPHGEFTEAKSCAEWRQRVNTANIRYLVIAPFRADAPLPPQAAWTAGDPAAARVVHQGTVSVFRIDRALDPAGCA